uniref:Uncharacterized protein n=1 Tax=Arundo donax TaxID=35708 RepID=A0A0A9FE91_ARUDO
MGGNLSPSHLYFLLRNWLHSTCRFKFFAAAFSDIQSFFYIFC